jgi:hypothetical protein
MFSFGTDCSMSLSAPYYTTACVSFVFCQLQRRTNVRCAYMSLQNHPYRPRQVEVGIFLGMLVAPLFALQQPAYTMAASQRRTPSLDTISLSGRTSDLQYDHTTLKLLQSCLNTQISLQHRKNNTATVHATNRLQHNPVVFPYSIPGTRHCTKQKNMSSFSWHATPHWECCWEIWTRGPCTVVMNWGIEVGLEQCPSP